MDIAEKALVGRVRGRNYSVERPQQWAFEVWGHHLNDPPFIQSFVKGWFALRFDKLEKTNWVLSTIWHIDQTPILLQIWTPLFNLEQEQVDADPLYVYLLGLPLHF